MANEINWPGKSGKQYKYWIHPIDTEFEDKPGNYLYAKDTPNGRVPLYIGQTSSLEDRLADHEKEPCAKKNGATHVHAHTEHGGEAIRRLEEEDLVQKWDPVCNG